MSSESAILAQARRAAGNGASPLLKSMLTRHGALTTELLLQAQQEGDPVVCRIMENAVSYLGIEIANIFNFISPSLITVDGLIFENEENRRTLLNVAHKNLFGLMASEAKLEFLPYNKMAGAYGAAAFVIRRCLLS